MSLIRTHIALFSFLCVINKQYYTSKLSSFFSLFFIFFVKLIYLVDAIFIFVSIYYMSIYPEGITPFCNCSMCCGYIILKMLNYFLFFYEKFFFFTIIIHVHHRRNGGIFISIFISTQSFLMLIRIFIMIYWSGV